MRKALEGGRKAGHLTCAVPVDHRTCLDQTARRALFVARVVPASNFTPIYIRKGGVLLNLNKATRKLLY